MIRHEVAITKEALEENGMVLVDALRTIERSTGHRTEVTITLCQCPANEDIVFNSFAKRDEQHAVHLIGVS